MQAGEVQELHLILVLLLAMEVVEVELLLHQDLLMVQEILVDLLVVDVVGKMLNLVDQQLSHQILHLVV